MKCSDGWVLMLILSAVAALCSLIALAVCAYACYNIAFSITLALFALCLIMMAISLKKI